MKILFRNSINAKMTFNQAIECLKSKRVIPETLSQFMRAGSSNRGAVVVPRYSVGRLSAIEQLALEPQRHHPQRPNVPRAFSPPTSPLISRCVREAHDVFNNCRKGSASRPAGDARPQSKLFEIAFLSPPAPNSTS